MCARARACVTQEIEQGNVGGQVGRLGVRRAGTEEGGREGKRGGKEGKAGVRV